MNFHFTWKTKQKPTRNLHSSTCLQWHLQPAMSMLILPPCAITHHKIHEYLRGKWPTVSLIFSTALSRSCSAWSFSPIVYRRRILEQLYISRHCQVAWSTYICVAQLGTLKLNSWLYRLRYQDFKNPVRDMGTDYVSTGLRITWPTTLLKKAL